ncbi:GNAT family N-acetyltransferase [Streptomyces mobaraensis NBRC 13819 = DSM 40847]|uniref:GCN5-related N-acetyltransferase n=1 Tax=Streptomyces mobaraensis (strain ATCC 29032 / DSM 40847 / JCM 4168 / NBRC 13819 / NCIMB 11159 / IPCR 16-22) TaxID=1223523 RepID=M3C0C1_STRM1|nr:GNAT family N-acetyltransferase [Streptomyces mobaraensis]EME97435.1 GCN5-related N-acetyltransferase [Streptomyces mobaraensis NBRC 13819 = DSM 40847]QTT72945.1 GNAT family N-acetyltransferase [Streptomyces mobaraensis NBRC 13819 = DSM 40847]
MPADLLPHRARELWTELASAPVRFPTTPDVDVAVSPRSRLCPPSWTGIVVLDGAGIATAPNTRTAALLADAADELSPGELVDPDRLRGTLPLLDVRGPASLHYLDRTAFRRRDEGAAVEVTPCDGDRSAVLPARAGEEDVEESGLAEITSPACVLRDGDDVIAAAGFRAWPRSVAHLSVLVAPDARGRGLARVVASAAVARALDAGLLPQWRARTHASRRVALALGFRELGTQLSIRLADGT